MQKERLDCLVFERGLADSRQKASALIMAGRILVDGRLLLKSGQRVSKEAALCIKSGGPGDYVSRGGDKLEAALDYFAIIPESRVALDLGASTGGFSDCLLQRGAASVCALDVGYNQLDYRLRSDPRVVVMERTHVRDLRADMLPDGLSLVTVDLSFISLRSVLPHLVSLLPSCFDMLLLVKPQFELGRAYIQKGGVVRGAEDQLLAVDYVRHKGEELGLHYVGYCPSALKGRKKANQEYFVYFAKAGD